MLARYPVLSLISTVSLALAVAIGAAAFAFISMILWPSIPLPDGDSIVSVRLLDEASNQHERRLTADFLRWRAGTTTLTDVAAGRIADRNMTMGDGTMEAVSVAEVTASTFTLGRITPVIGRVLTDDDASPAAPPVMVIGQKLWRERFAADPAIVGRELMLGETPTTVVGVLPEVFKFPSTFEVWQPLKLDEAGAMPRRGMGFDVWARLRRGATLASATSELTSLVKQSAVEWPATHARLRPDIRPYAEAFLNFGPEEKLALGSLNVVIGLLIVVISGNVALLMFARAATRESEIIVRSALGAGRGRIVAQFFAESLVLSVGALAIGIALAQWGVRYGLEEFIASSRDGRPLPFWVVPHLPPLSIAFGIGLALLATLITSVLPAMKVTRGLSSRLRETAAGGGGLKFGGVWTVLIVTQITLTMAVPVLTYFVQRGSWDVQAIDIGVPQSEYLIAKLSPASGMSPARFASDVRAIREGLPSLLGVTHATVADRVPFLWQGPYLGEVDEGGAAPPDYGSGYRVSTAAVDPDFFSHFEMPPLAGRLFSESDYVGRPRVAVVNQLFVDRVLGGRNPIGRRVKYKAVNKDQPPIGRTDNDQPWLEIVGLVRDVSMGIPGYQWGQGLYTPLDLKSVSEVVVTARVQSADAFSGAAAGVRALAAKTDPTLRVDRVQSLADIPLISVREIGYWVKLLATVSGWVLLLALSGIFAVMSFAVTRRTHEIGIRIALGSTRVRVLLAILRGPIVQVFAGIVLGTLLGLALVGAISLTPGHLLAMAGYVIVMVGVCLLACLVPVRRALKVDPIAALRTE